MCSAKAIKECYRRAEEARRIADATDDPVARDDFRDIERRWLSVAGNCKCNEQSKQRFSEERTLRSELLPNPPALLVASGHD